MSKEAFPSRPTEVLDNQINDRSRVTEIMDDQRNNGSRATEIMGDENFYESRETETMDDDTLMPDRKTMAMEDCILENKKRHVTIGDVIGSGYKLINIIAENTGEAKIFLCIKNNKQFVAKIYRENKRPKDNIIELLKTNASPYIIKIIEDGEVNERYFEIQEYYSKKDLQSNLPISNDFIINTVVPNINEGLHAIHSSGIIHKDIKPNNIFLSNDQKHVVIGDFGISSMLDSRLSVRMTTAARTVGYSAPETLIQRKLDNNSMGSKETGYYMPASKEGDYYAFGITLLHLVLGRDPFFGMSDAQIILHTSHYKLDIPPIPRLEQLIRGLTVKERQDRWGYDEVKKWINNESVEVKERRYFRRDITPYIFEEEEIYSLEDLAIRFAERWDEAKKRIYRHAELLNQVKEFIKQFGSDVIAKCLDYIEDVEDYDIGLLNIIYALNPNAPLCWCGEILGSLDSFLSTITDQSPNFDEKYIDMLERGAISEFLKIKDFSEDLVKKVKEIEEKERNKEIAYFKLVYLLKPDIDLCWRGEWFDDPVSLSKAIVKSDVKKNKNYVDLLKSGALVHFLKIKYNDNDFIDKIENLQSENDGKWILFKLIYILNPDTPLQWNIGGLEIRDLGKLGSIIIQDQRKEIANVLDELYDMLGSGALRCFLEVKNYDSRLTEKVRQLERYEIFTKRNMEIIMFKLAYILNPKQKLFWRKEEIGDLKGLRDALERTIPRTNYDYADLVKSGALTFFLDIKGYDEKWINKFEEIKLEADRQLAYFKMIYLLIPDAPLIWNGRKLDKLEDIRFSTSGESLLSSGALQHYLEIKGYDSKLIREVKSLSNYQDSEKALYKFRFLINPQEKVWCNDRYFGSLDELIECLLKIGYEKGIESIENTLMKLQGDKGFCAWLEHLGHEKILVLFKDIKVEKLRKKELRKEKIINEVFDQYTCNTVERMIRDKREKSR